MSGDVLLRAVRALSEGLQDRQLLAALTGELVPSAADWAVADLLEPPDLVTRVAAVGPSGPLALPAEAQVDLRRSSAQAVGLLPVLLAAPRPVLRLSAAELTRMAAGPEPRLASQAALALRLGTSELLVLGLARHDELLGVLSLGRASGTFTDAEVDQLVAVASAAALAVDGVRLLELQHGVSTALQRSLLPQLPVVPHLTLAARFVPASSSLAVGGDWYDAFVLPDGDVALVVGDATGHDVHAATGMAELRNLLRALAVDQQDPPAATLTRLDRVVARVAPELSGTCVYARVDGHGEARELRWSSAGHLPPVLLRDGRAQVLDTPPDLMLGVREGSARHDHVLPLRTGDLLVLCTDGLVEDRRTSLDVRLEVLARLVEREGAGSAETLADALVAGLATGDDDVAVLVVRLEAPGRRP